ncbi:MAG TPA: glycosyltransferase [Anaerolineae bacterium]|nr:glycosyltransferase [Anaerolineae bacterium]
MKRVVIGISVHEQPEGLRSTLHTLRSHTPQPIEVILLPDGPDQATQRALLDFDDLPQLGTPAPLGAPACFNRLVAGSSADVLVLMESGALPGPGWLDHLLAALDADPHHGLAGPSTNRSWNEQGVFPRAGGSLVQVQAMAQEAQSRFGSAWRTLQPLYSLADFCYAVKREVVGAIGVADEGYGLGPCWEMDYNIRAARAGFAGVWACAAYVWRAPFTARRRREEAACFLANKQRYQDKFCALRLRGERPGYENHCRGDACEHFAPPGLIQMHLPQAQPASAALGAVVRPPISPDLPRDAASLTQHGSHSTAPMPVAPSPRGQPLVSCIMPTGNRADFVLQSIQYLQRQDWSNWELIILDDGDDGLASRLPDDARVRYHAVPRGLSIGVKRNRGCALAQGEFIAQWDDDDWYGPGRLSTQLAPLLAGQADISGLHDTTFFDLDRWTLWRCTPALHRRLFVEDVHGGTLVYRRDLWQRTGGYPDRSLAEDAWFLRQAIRLGGRLARLSGLGHFIYLRHGGNSWSFVCGQYLDPQGWQRIDVSLLPADATAFFAGRSPHAPTGQRASATSHSSVTQPLVSCIMPTADRRAFVEQAIRYFLRQDYPRCELLIVDDGREPVADLAQGDPSVRYLRVEGRQELGVKRNLACEQAHGEIIVHWDDDDWQAPWRVSYQAAQLLAQGADVCGVDNLLYYQPWTGQAWQYAYPAGEQAWVGGNSLCYTRSFWRRNPFPAITVGEDSRFLWSSQPKRLLALADNRFLVGLIHPGNTSAKRTANRRWQPYVVSGIQALLAEDWKFYARLANGGIIPDHERKSHLATADHFAR